MIWRMTLKKTVKRKRGRGALKDKDSIAVHKAEARATEIKHSTFALGKAPEQLRLILHMDDADEAKEELDRFFWRATHSRIEEFKELGHKIRRHEQHILNTIRLKMSNARIESTNNKIKFIIRRAFGFRDVANIIDMIMLVCSNIKVPLPNRPVEVPET